MLRDLIFIDETRMSSYVSQTEQGGSGGSVKASVRLPFGTGVEWSSPSSVSPVVLDAKIDRLLDALRDSGRLSAVRPCDLSLHPSSEGPRLVHEFVTATRILMPLPEWVPGGPKAITVWVAEPDVSADYLSPENHNFYPIFDTAFLYLLQEHWPEAPTERFVSGCSALQMVANAAAQERLDDPGWPPVDLGRHNPQHPIAKLVELGGLVLGSRRLESLYQVRYVSNEQSYCYLPETQDGAADLDWTWLRVHDVLAYPLFIAAEA